MPRTVAVVFAPDYAAELEKLAFRMPVWLVDTPVNHRAAEDAWRAALEWPHVTVTLFRPPPAHPTRDEWTALLEQISLRERAVEAIEVIGTPMSVAARAVLVEAGFARFDETPNGFKARR
jgi:hypothetical protein